VDSHVEHAELKLASLTEHKRALRMQAKRKLPPRKKPSQAEDPSFLERISKAFAIIDSFGNNDGEITLDELLASIRRSAHKLIAND
jgi:hypothetical protein